GIGVCIVSVDPASGRVTTASMEQSTGDSTLDKSAVNAFRKWRFKPGTVSKVRIPIEFNMTSASQHQTSKSAEITSYASVKAFATLTPLPTYPLVAKRRGFTGIGVCIVSVDRPSGRVTGASMEQSTGHLSLDKAAIDAFRSWRFKPGTVSKFRIP